MDNLEKEILRLKKEKNAVILGHYYQTLDIQLIADFAGDSFDLSKRAKNASENLIVFCGVSFMAESAKLLSPHKKVLLPNADAGCPMADMVTPEIVREMRAANPNAAVVCYVNSSAETKAECDICCTSSNAVNIVKKLDAQEIIFVPDKNLGAYVAQFVPDKRFVFMDGYCPIHHFITVEEAQAKLREFPGAKFAAHPECDPAVAALADFVGSTSQILSYCETSESGEYIIGTEYAIAERLRHYRPERRYHILTPALVCPNMKKTTMQDLYNCLANENENGNGNGNGKNVIELPGALIAAANKPLEKMLELG